MPTQLPTKREPDLPRRTTLASLAGEEPPVHVSMIGMTVARRFSGATDNADNGTDSLDIACDMITEESINLEETTMKVVAPPSSTFHDPRRKNAFSDPRRRKTASERCLFQWNDEMDHRGSFSNLTKSDAPPPCSSSCGWFFKKSKDFSGQHQPCLITRAKAHISLLG
jgi:hypothetical protein